MAKTVHNFEVAKIDGTPKKLADYDGKVTLIVNVASQCGLTPQYAGLQSLYDQYASRGFTVLAFPSNDFGAQEPGTNEQIKEFCTSRFNVTFDLFAKVRVKGPGIDPLFAFLTSPATTPKFSGELKWNFNKFLVGKHGEVLARFEPTVDPTSPEVKAAVEKALTS
ncbi:MAG: glutathione peroxidase [Polyangiaceae bacterium]